VPVVPRSMLTLCVCGGRYRKKNPRRIIEEGFILKKCSFFHLFVCLWAHPRFLLLICPDPWVPFTFLLATHLGFDAHFPFWLLTHSLGSWKPHSCWVASVVTPADSVRGSQATQIMPLPWTQMLLAPGSARSQGGTLTLAFCEAFFFYR
jgi:hypothetical protein